MDGNHFRNGLFFGLRFEWCGIHFSLLKIGIVCGLDSFSFCLIAICAGEVKIGFECKYTDNGAKRPATID